MLKGIQWFCANDAITRTNQSTIQP
ncbi:unnamed protein product, partial [Rotaria sp. Silwood1]